MVSNSHAFLKEKYFQNQIFLKKILTKDFVDFFCEFLVVEMFFFNSPFKYEWVNSLNFYVQKKIVTQLRSYFLKISESKIIFTIYLQRKYFEKKMELYGEGLEMDTVF